MGGSCTRHPLRSVATCARLLDIAIDSIANRLSGSLDLLRGFLGAADVDAGYETVDYDVAIEGPTPAAEDARLVDTDNRRFPVHGAAAGLAA